ncbi:MAG: MerR family transcriptional regulator [Lachnospiraceae bacterium]|nr:MerR family transcriptional regulator [Lachnospiraceae bacterium]
MKVAPQNGYRYYSAAQVQQLNALLELKTLGFSLEEIKSVLDGDTTGEGLLNALAKKRQAWQEAMETASYKSACLESILRNSRDADRMTELTDDERAWLLVKMVCIEDVRAQKALSEALWL